MMWHYNVIINISIAVCEIKILHHHVIICYSVQLYSYNVRMLWGFCLSNISYPQPAAAV